MQCLATKVGYLGKIRLIGDIVEWDSNEPLPTWLKEINPKELTQQDTGLIEDDTLGGAIHVPVVKSDTKVEAEKVKQIEKINELDSLRAEAKLLGYAYWRNAGKKKLQDYIAKNKK